MIEKFDLVNVENAPIPEWSMRVISSNRDGSVWIQRLDRDDSIEERLRLTTETEERVRDTVMTFHLRMRMSRVVEVTSNKDSRAVCV